MRLQPLILSASLPIHWGRSTIAWASVSVAMATYNGGRFLKEQLDSIAGQSALPLELVISDDGSTDGTLAIAESFSKTAPFPVAIHQNAKNLGYARNFRAAASRCKGELIAFCDQDDRWHPRRLETCLPHFSDPELLLLYHNAMVIDEEGQGNGRLYDLATERLALNLKPIGPWNYCNGLVQIFRSRLREYDDLWDQSISHVTADILSHDRWYFFLAQVLGRVDFLDEALVDYRQHQSNTFGPSQTRPAVERSFFARLRHHGREDILKARAAKARSNILKKLADRVPDSKARLLLLADRYSLLHQRNLRRYHTYCGVDWQWRLASFLSSCRARDYSDWPWGFDRRSVVRDLWSGVIRGQC